MLKGSKMSGETRKKMSLAKIGHIPWNRGKKGLNIKHEKQFKKGQVAWNKGIPQTEEMKRRLSLSKMGKYRGEKHPHWQGGKNAYQKKQAKKRDNYRCQKCDFYNEEFKGSAVDVDHILSKRKYPELKDNLDNLMTLCPNCHRLKSLREKDYFNLRYNN